MTVFPPFGIHATSINALVILLPFFSFSLYQLFYLAPTCILTLWSQSHTFCSPWVLFTEKLTKITFPMIYLNNWFFFLNQNENLIWYLNFVILFYPAILLFLVIREGVKEQRKFLEKAKIHIIFPQCSYFWMLFDGGCVSQN